MSQGRLEVLETGDAATSLRELLSWRHRQLSEPAAVMFTLLGVHCGPDITVPAAASLAGVPASAARELADASLAAEHRPGRYVLHDLVRTYAPMPPGKPSTRSARPGSEACYPQPGPLPAHYGRLLGRHPVGLHARAACGQGAVRAASR